MIVGFADGMAAEDVAALPAYGQVPAVRADSAVLIDDGDSARR